MVRARSQFRLGDTEIGGDEFVVMAGPCAVETEGQLLETARSVARAGARVLRGGAFKPRTSPYSFQGLGERGLELLAKAREVTGLPVVTEVMSDTQAHLVAAYADMLQIGSRSMENEALLRAAARTGRPILLKRGMVATIEEMIEAAEFLAGNGAEEIVLCERGIRTYGTATRNTCDIAAIPLLKKLTGLPVILDPSHASGRRDLVPALSKAGVAVGADGLLIEVHHHAEAAWSDAEQTLGTADFEELLAELQPHLRIWKEARSAVFATRA